MADFITEGNKEVLKEMTKAAPTGRLRQPEKIADALLWLCSDASSYVTGESLWVDGVFYRSSMRTSHGVKYQTNYFSLLVYISVFIYVIGSQSTNKFSNSRMIIDCFKVIIIPFCAKVRLSALALFFHFTLPLLTFSQILRAEEYYPIILMLTLKQNDIFFESLIVIPFNA